MDDLALNELGNLVGLVTGGVVGGVLVFLLRHHVRRKRLRRAAVWFVAWGAGALVLVAMSVLVAGTHQVHRVRRQGGFTDFHWTWDDALSFSLFIGVIAACLAFWLPWQPGAHSSLSDESID